MARGCGFSLSVYNRESTCCSLHCLQIIWFFNVLYLSVFNYSGWWLNYPSEKYESQLGWFFPTEWKNNVPKTHVPNHQPVLIIDLHKDTLNYSMTHGNDMGYDNRWQSPTCQVVQPPGLIINRVSKAATAQLSRPSLFVPSKILFIVYPIILQLWPFTSYKYL